VSEVGVPSEVRVVSLAKASGPGTIEATRVISVTRDCVNQFVTSTALDK